MQELSYDTAQLLLKAIQQATQRVVSSGHELDLLATAYATVSKAAPKVRERPESKRPMVA